MLPFVLVPILMQVLGGAQVVIDRWLSRLGSETSPHTLTAELCGSLLD